MDRCLETSSTEILRDASPHPCPSSKLGGAEIETGTTEDPREEGLPEWDPDWRRQWLLDGTLPCHPLQHPGPSHSLWIGLFSLPSVSCLPPKEELLARFLKAGRRAQQQGENKNKTKNPKQPAKPPLLAVADTNALSFLLKSTECPGRHFIHLHLPLFKAKSSPEKASLLPKDMVSTKW